MAEAVDDATDEVSHSLEAPVDEVSRSQHMRVGPIVVLRVSYELRFKTHL